MCCSTVLANYLFCLVSVILKQSHITQVFYHTRSLSHARFLVVLFLPMADRHHDVEPAS